MKRELYLDDLKRIETEILDYVAQFCDNNGLRYFIDSGTLLGAVRHKGFIPWDDDIDIVMPRDDYEKFHTLFPKDGRFRLLSLKNNPDYIYAFSKVVDSSTELIEDLTKDIQGYGIYIDIFPFDGLPDDERKCKRFQDRIWFYRALATVASRQLNENDSLRLRILYRLVSRIGSRRLINKIDKLIRTYDIKKTKYGSKLTVSSDKYRKTKNSMFDEVVELEFEGKKYAAPADYHEYLTIMYGDYMQLPPKDKQVSHHYFKAYQKDDK